MSLPEPFALVAAALECDPSTLSAESGLNQHPAWDSMGHLSVIMALESHYGVVVDDTAIRRFEKMAAILDLYRQASGFDSRWETDIYARGRMLNRYPSEIVVSFAMTAFPVDQRAGKRVLDLGCGAGNNAWFLAREGFDVVAVDGSPSAIEVASRRLEADGLRADLRVMDFTVLALPDASVDCVIDRCSISHNRRVDIEKVLDEVRRVLKPGGLFLSQMFSTRLADREFGRPLGDGAWDGFTAGYFRDIALAFFADRSDMDTLYGSRFLPKSLQHVTIEDENGRVSMAHWNGVWKRP